jgi:hypothetical protein
VALTLDHLQQREEHCAIVDLVGKGGHIRTVPVPSGKEVRTRLGTAFWTSSCPSGNASGGFRKFLQPAHFPFPLAKIANCFIIDSFSRHARTL